MYLFARSRAVNPARGREAVAIAIEAGSRAGEIVGFPVYTWTTILSPGFAAMWSARFEHLDDVIAAQDALSASGEFMDWVEGNDGLFTGPVVDVVSNVVHGAPTGEPPAFIQVVQGTCANGSMSEGMAIGVELAETASRLTGLQTMFVTPVIGRFGGVGWLTGFETLNDLEAGNATLTANNDWFKLVDRAGQVYLPGAETSLIRRVA